MCRTLTFPACLGRSQRLQMPMRLGMRVAPCLMLARADNEVDATCVLLGHLRLSHVDALTLSAIRCRLTSE